MAAGRDGTVYIDTRLNTDGFNRGMNTVQSRVGGLSSAFSKLGGVISAAFAVGALIRFGAKAIELGSDLQEVQNVVDVTFTTMSDKVNEFAQNAAMSAGLSETMAKRYVGTFGAMSKSFRFAEAEAYEMSTTLTQLSGDVASFYNITQDEAYTKLKSVFTGETESLKDLGVVMTQAALDSYAMANGFGKTTQQMTEQEKVSLRYRFVLDQLSGASGDFIRTQDSWANQMRILKLQIESIMASIGQALINFFTPVIKLINIVLSKIAVVANAFKSFSEMIMGKKASSGGGAAASPTGAAAEDLQNLENGYSDSAKGAKKLADSTKKSEKATKSAEKANQKYLSGLDEIRTFTSEKDAGADVGDLGDIGDLSGIGGLGSPLDSATIEEGVESLQEANSVLDALMKRMKELAALFVAGFKDGLGDITGRMETIKQGAASIKESLAYIFDAELGDSVNKFLDAFTFGLGQLVGAVASIGLTIGANLVGGIAKWLEQDKDRIKNFLISMFDIGAELSAVIGNAASALAFMLEPIASESGQRITADILSIFGNAFMVVVELATQFATDVFTTIAQPFIDLKVEIQSSIQTLLDGFASVTTALSTIVSDISGQLMQIYDEFIAPFLGAVQEDITALLDQHLIPLVNKVGEFFDRLGQAAMQLWNTTLKPLIQWIIDNVLPVLLPILNSVSGAVGEAIGMISDIVSGLIEILSGVIDFVVGVFTGNWEMAWEGVKSIFAGIINTIAGILEGFINMAIELLNGIIGGINAITGLAGLPEIPLIPELDIPELATGAVIPPNAPFLALLGDQRHGKNIEAPLDTIKQAVKEVVGNGGNGSVIHAHLYLEGREIYSAVINEGKLQQAATGINKFVTL